MPRALLTPFVIAGLLFLPSCSSAEAKACEAALNTKLSLEQEIERDTKAIQGELKQQDKVLYEYLLSELPINQKRLLLVIINNQACFTPYDVANAQIELEKM